MCSIICTEGSTVSPSKFYPYHRTTYLFSPCTLTFFTMRSTKNSADFVGSLLEQFSIALLSFIDPLLLSESSETCFPSIFLSSSGFPIIISPFSEGITLVRYIQTVFCIPSSRTLTMSAVSVRAPKGPVFLCCIFERGLSA